MNEQEAAPDPHQSEEAATAVWDFEHGPGVRFTYDGSEYEAAWDQTDRVAAYRCRMTSESDERET